MREVGIRDLKDRLSEVLRIVRRQGLVYITRRGEIVAELRSSYGTAERQDVAPGLRELADAGSLKLGAPHDPDLYAERPRLDIDGGTSRLLDDVRGR